MAEPEPLADIETHVDLQTSRQTGHLPLCCPGGLTASEEVQQCGSIDLPSPLTSPSVVPVVLRPARRSSNVDL